MVMYVSALLSQSYPLLPLLCPKVCSLRLHLDSCPANELIGTIFLDSTCVCVCIYIYIYVNIQYLWGFPDSSVGKESACSDQLGFNPWDGKIPWRKERLPTPVFWPGEFQGLYSPQGHKESDTTERLSLSDLTSLCVTGSGFIHLTKLFKIT